MLPCTPNSIAVSVIIPTTCEERRWSMLQRAIASLASQEQGEKQVQVRIIVVVNGPHFSPARVAQLQAMKQVRVLVQETGSAPLAQRLGRQAVDTDYFSFLDDDDEYLPGALWHRLQPLLADPQLAFVASNGYRMRQGQQSLVVAREPAVVADPLSALAQQNWLSSCGGLFRSALVEARYFDDPVPYYEWTYLAYKLTLALPMRWVSEPTYRIHDTQQSLSKSVKFRDGEALVLKRILALQLPRTVVGSVKAKLARMYHDLSDTHFEMGNAGQAWRFHLLSLVQRGGWRYLFYTRRLVGMLLPG